MYTSRWLEPPAVALVSTPKVLYKYGPLTFKYSPQSLTSSPCSPALFRSIYCTPIIHPSIQIHPGISMVRAVSIAICHGGGPLPVMDHPGSAEISKSLRIKVPKLLRLGTPDAPSVIVAVTAHWSERKQTISNGKRHTLYYDYYGFPPEA